MYHILSLSKMCYILTLSEIYHILTNTERIYAVLIKLTVLYTNIT